MLNLVVMGSVLVLKWFMMSVLGWWFMVEMVDWIFGNVLCSIMYSCVIILVLGFMSCEMLMGGSLILLMSFFLVGSLSKWDFGGEKVVVIMSIVILMLCWVVSWLVSSSVGMSCFMLGFVSMVMWSFELFMNYMECSSFSMSW